MGRFPGTNQISLYRGRIAPSPTGYLHLGHARTFWIAYQRTMDAKGVLVFRNEDLDRNRCRKEFVQAMYEDLGWFGIQWQEGPDRGGPVGPYSQAERMDQYIHALCRLAEEGWVYPCSCSRQDVRRAIQAPHMGEAEPLYSGTCRPSTRREFRKEEVEDLLRTRCNWRFRTDPKEIVSFVDGAYGVMSSQVGIDFGDFVVWRGDGVPAYQLAVVVDDAAMGITEVVRGCDLLSSTARQVLIYRALRLDLPAFFHCKLVMDVHGKRLAKRHDDLSLRQLRTQGSKPEEIRQQLGIT